MKPLYYIYTGLASAGIFIISIPFIILDFWLLFIPKNSRWSIAQTFLIRPWTFIVNHLIFFMRIKIINKEYIHKEQVRLFICNHQSWVDIPTLLKYNNTTAISKKNVTKIPMIGILIQYAGTLLFDRDSKKDRLHLIKDLIKFFRQKHSLTVFPEGTRSLNGKLQTPNLALIKLCYKMKIPVVPCAIEGTRFVLGRGQGFIRFGQKAIIQYSEPVYSKDFENDEKFADYCWDKVVKSYGEIQTLHSQNQK